MRARALLRLQLSGIWSRPLKTRFTIRPTRLCPRLITGREWINWTRSRRRTRNCLPAFKASNLTTTRQSFCRIRARLRSTRGALQASKMAAQKKIHSLSGTNCRKHWARRNCQHCRVWVVLASLENSLSTNRQIKVTISCKSSLTQKSTLLSSTPQPIKTWCPKL